MKNLVSKFRKNDKGFTLVELIVVIIILAILIGVTVAGVTKYIGQSRKNTDANNISSMNSILSSLTASEDIYKEAASTSGVINCKYSWGRERGGTVYTPKTMSAGAGQWNNDTISDDFKSIIATEVDALFPDGLPKSQTGNGFMIHLRIKDDADGNRIITFKVTAYEAS